VVEQGVQGVAGSARLSERYSPVPARPRLRRPGSESLAFVVPGTVVVIVGLILPLALMARYSLNRWVPGELMQAAFTWENYARFFSDAFYVGVLWRTLGISLAATGICLLLGLPAAYYLSRLRNHHLKTAIILGLVIPLLMGNAVRAAGWMVLLADKGLFNSIMMFLGVYADPIRILYTGSAVAIGLVAVLLPFMIICLQSVFDGISEAYEEAAMSLGARPLTMFRRVLLPMIMPGIFSGSALCFVLAMNAYATPVLIGGPSFQMMAPKIYEQAIKVFNWPFAASMAFVLMAVTLALTILASVALQRRYGKL
jgi:putative spermidine/putrescine transport system permease protein